MKIQPHKITVKELVTKYKNNQELGVWGYEGKLNIRPIYQREFVYNYKQQVEVINSINKGYPLNSIFWSDEGTHYELIDGQQRIMSICNYVNGDFAVKNKYYKNCNEVEKQKILNYELTVFICVGNQQQKLDWFEIINKVGMPLTAQELRNAVYTGKWLTNAKSMFSKINSPGAQMAKNYLNGSAIRQEYLETILKWIAHKDKTTINLLMAKYQHEPSATDLWTYFEKVIDWIEAHFKVRPKLMKGQPWGILYNKYHKQKLDPIAIEKQTNDLLNDEEVAENDKGIYYYILSGNTKYLNLRTFKDKIKQLVYDEQEGKCKLCQQAITLENSEADHIVPWTKGGKTTEKNCQMLCMPCNRQKGKQ